MRAINIEKEAMQKEGLPQGSPIVKENSVNLEEKDLRFTLINARIFRVLIDEVDEALKGLKTWKRSVKLTPKS